MGNRYFPIELPTVPGLLGDGDRNVAVLAKELHVHSVAAKESPGQKGTRETWGFLTHP